MLSIHVVEYKYNIKKQKHIHLFFVLKSSNLRIVWDLYIYEM